MVYPIHREVELILLQVSTKKILTMASSNIFKLIISLIKNTDF